MASGGDVDHAGFEADAFEALAHGELGGGVEALGEELGKHGRHVLHHHDGNREVLGERRDHFRQSVGAAG